MPLTNEKKLPGTVPNHAPGDYDTTQHDPRSEIAMASIETNIDVLPSDGRRPKVNLFSMVVSNFEMCCLKSPSSFAMVYGRKG